MDFGHETIELEFHLLRAAAKYRYEKDYTVAERQCGKLTFIVKIQK